MLDMEGITLLNIEHMEIYCCLFCNIQEGKLMKLLGIEILFLTREEHDYDLFIYKDYCYF